MFDNRYLVKLVTAEYDANFVKYLDYVGKIHTAYSGKASRVNVEYVHCSALFTYVSSFIIEALIGAGQPKRTIVAFNKLLWIQVYEAFFLLFQDQKSHDLCTERLLCQVVRARQ